MVIRHLASASLLMGAVPALHAQGIATDKQIESITVTAARERAGVAIPNTTASRTAQELRTQNLVNPEDALKYVPNLTIRKRYIGDRNALIGGRSFSPLQAPRGLVFMDGYLLSNFLGRFDAPRWNMIAAEEIERVDVLYGPFSAIYPGNSIGTTVVVTTRKPQELELGVRTTGFSERYEEYGLEDDYSGHQLSGWLGHRLGGSGWYSLAANRQDSISHPMQYYSVSADPSGMFAPPPGSAAAIPVTGVVFDRDPRGRRRAVFGANAGAIDHTVQTQVKLRGGYAIDDWIELESFVAAWDNESRSENRTLMRDAAGNEVWRGRVLADGIEFDVPSTAFAPSTRDELHVHLGATLRTTLESGWNGSLIFSRYDIRQDHALEADAADPEAALGGAGTSTERDGTGWRTLEAQGVYTPVPGDWTRRAHTIALGYHRNDYRLENAVYSTADWRTRSGEPAQDARGDTRLQAVYLQDVWSLRDRWTLTLGMRYEDWRATRGFQFARGLAPQLYPDRSAQYFSPKASVRFSPDEAWSMRLSAGRGVRFPTVAELFLGTVTATQITRNDPNLKPEISDAIDFTIERRLPWGRLRTSIFQDDVRDTIWNQVNILVFPRQDTVQNVDRVRTRGIEASFNIERLGLDSLSLEGNVAYARSRILRNDKNPAYVGNEWPRIPDWRANVRAVWRPAQAWLASLGLRYSGRMHGRLENDDIHPETYGGISRFAILDTRLAYTTASNIELALGIDNITDERSYQFHPYPARTGYVEARWSFKGAAQ